MLKPLTSSIPAFPTRSLQPGPQQPRGRAVARAAAAEPARQGGGQVRMRCAAQRCAVLYAALCGGLCAPGGQVPCAC